LTPAPAGGGAGYLAPRDYTSARVYLRSHVRFYIEAGRHAVRVPGFTRPTRCRRSTPTAPAVDGCTRSSWARPEYITIEAPGTGDGQAEYVWRAGKSGTVGCVPTRPRQEFRRMCRGRAEDGEPGSKVSGQPIPLFGHIPKRRIGAGKASGGQPLMRLLPQRQ